MLPTKVLKNYNTTKTEIFACNGDSVHLMPGVKTTVEDKFLWNLPKGVREFKEDETVFTKTEDSIEDNKDKD